MNCLRCFAFLLLLFFLSSCVGKLPEQCAESTSLYAVADFPIGVAINPQRLYFVPEYHRIATTQFNSFTPENVMKADHLHPGEHVYDWTEADALADTCARYKIRLHGHTLIWHQAVPDWITYYQGSSDDWKDLFREHIQTTVRHFKGRVVAWDVVNEAFNEDGTLRNSLWRKHIGDDYIELAFRYAQEADPNALLFYNDFNLELNPVKRANVLAFLDRIKLRGVRVDGIGVQMHVRLHDPDPSDLSAAFADIANHRYQLHLSELDISVNPFSKAIADKSALFREQARYLEQIIRCYRQVPIALRYGVNFWGVSDADSWIPGYFSREDYPLLYDQQYAPKPAYCLLKEIL